MYLHRERGATTKGAATASGPRAGPQGGIACGSLSYLLLLALIASFPTAASALSRDRWRDLLHFARIGARVQLVKDRRWPWQSRRAKVARGDQVRPIRCQEVPIPQVHQDRSMYTRYKRFPWTMSCVLMSRICRKSEKAPVTNWKKGRGCWGLFWGTRGGGVCSQVAASCDWSVAPTTPTNFGDFCIVVSGPQA